jgi:hypothetical protein
MTTAWRNAVVRGLFRLPLHLLAPIIATDVQEGE